MTFYSEIEQLTIELVKTPSMNNTVGEKAIAEKVAAYFRGLEYFQRHPGYVWELPLKDDKFGRKNIIALVKGQKGGSGRTVILHGHLDTVGVEDYGPLQELAFDPAALEAGLRDMILPPEVRNDLDSGQWLFGRGALDMKSGLAAHMAVLKYISRRAAELEGNVLFMANPVEENQHTGIMEALPFLESLRHRETLDYVVAVNNDYISPLYGGDDKKYIYLGAVGKLLPCFYIAGKETHVGQCFEGLDPNLVAAELLRLINLNTGLCDQYNGEYTLPPAALKFTDLKPSYNVQTPLAAFLYFNYFTHDISVNRVVELLKDKARTAFANVLQYLDQQYRDYCGKSGLTYKPLGWEPRVTTYEELYNEVGERLGDRLDKMLKQLVDELLSRGTDTRIICLRVVEEVKKHSLDTRPAVVLFFAPPYCPHNTIKGETATERELLAAIREVTGEIASSAGEAFDIKQFFPCLSDSSYLKMDDGDKSVAALINNFPQWHTVYPVPVHEIRRADIPAVNFGSYGKDAHRWTERVHKHYTFSVLPAMTVKFIERILTGKRK